ncbi:MAG: ABC transporter substrate-binding protein [Candidatus Altiarchaeota archaeon]|nr:ABC transporter substrate-binding protein [Candidatus Altiarchaeota archaeon]
MKYKIYAIIAVVFLLALALIYAGVYSGPKPESKPDTKLVVGVQNGLGFTMFYVAKEKGFFNSTGVELDIKTFSSAAEINEAMLGGSIELGLMGDSSTIILAAKKPVKVVATIVTGVYRRRVLVPMDSGVKNISDLDGKRIGLKKGGALHTGWLLIERYYGIKSSEILDIDYVNMPEALKTKQVDAVYAKEPTCSLIELKGYGKWVPVEPVPGMSDPLVVVATSKALSEKNESVVKFIRALKNAESFIKDNPEESVEIMSNVASLPLNVTKRVMEFDRYTANTTEEVYSDFEMVADLMTEEGTISKKPEGLFDMTYYDMA